MSPEIVIRGKNEMLVKNSDIAPVKLRQYLLYWDQIDFPENNAINFGGSPEIDFLQNAGVLKRSKINLNLNGEMVGLFLKSQTEAFKLNNEKEPGSWSLAQPNQSLALDINSSFLTRNLEIELYHCLPIPSTEVSLDDILIFKERRKEEFLEFRYLLDNLYLEIVNSGDQERAKLKNIELLQRKIVDINMVMDESYISRLAGSLKIEFDWKDLATKTGPAILGSLTGQYPMELGFAVGLYSSIKIGSEMSLRPSGVPDDLKDFAYLYYADKELL